MFFKKIRFKKEHISDAGQYTHLEEANAIFNYLLSNKTYIQFRKNSYTRLNANFYKLQWLASDRTLQNSFSFANLDKSKKTPGQDLIHSGIHYLISGAIGGSIAGCPKYTLLSEAMASSTDFYFTLKYVQSGKKVPMIATSFLAECKRLYIGKDSEFLRVFNAALENPFESYRKCVHEMFHLLLILEEQVSSKRSSNKEINDIDLNLDRYFLWPFITAFDLPMFCFYAQKHCKPQNRKLDDAKVRKLLSVLDSSKSYMDLIQKLIKLHP